MSAWDHNVLHCKECEGCSNLANDSVCSIGNEEIPDGIQCDACIGWGMAACMCVIERTISTYRYTRSHQKKKHPRRVYHTSPSKKNQLAVSFPHGHISKKWIISPKGTYKLALVACPPSPSSSCETLPATIDTQPVLKSTCQESRG